MAAYRQAKRMQRGALTAQGGFSTTDPAFRQAPFTIQCVIRPKKVTSGLQVAFNTKGDSSNPRIDLNTSGDIVIYGGGSVLYNNPANLDSIYDIVFMATDSQLSLFVDGTLITSVPYTSTISLYNIGFYYANNGLYFQGDYLLHRHFNYAMSADEVKALDNNNDPVGYVVPKAMRNSLLAEYLPQNLMEINRPSSPDISFPTSEYTESKGTFTANNPGTVSNTTFDNPAENGFSGPFIKDTAITKVSMYCAYHNRSEYLNIPIRLKVEYRCNADIYDSSALSKILLRANEADANEAYINYGPGSGFLVSAPNPDAWLEIRVLSIEFWNGVSSFWLDSAKQLPLSDEYMEPLFQSIGGYDMAANGAPEILYNE